MVCLGREITKTIVYEYGEEELVKRIADPFWFQSLSCVLGFDWHSSGTTTVTLGALKEGLRGEDLRLHIVGGKGKAMLRTICEIDSFDFDQERKEWLKYASRMCAKVDTSAIQSGHSIYHHSMIIGGDDWAVVQQGMRPEDKTARRYHWLGSEVVKFTIEPHRGIVGRKEDKVMNMVARESEEAQKISVDIVKEGPTKLKGSIVEVRDLSQRRLDDFLPDKRVRYLLMPKNLNWEGVRKAYEFQPRDYEEMLSVKGVGPSTVRALALISEVIYGVRPSYEDPVRYSFALGGKDGVPFPVDRRAMDESTEMLRDAIERAKLGREERIEAIRRLCARTTEMSTRP
jgi:hypothetical protein